MKLVETNKQQTTNDKQMNDKQTQPLLELAPQGGQLKTRNMFPGLGTLDWNIALHLGQFKVQTKVSSCKALPLRNCTFRWPTSAPVGPLVGPGLCVYLFLDI